MARLLFTQPLRREGGALCQGGVLCPMHVWTKLGEAKTMRNHPDFLIIFLPIIFAYFSSAFGGGKFVQILNTEMWAYVILVGSHARGINGISASEWCAVQVLVGVDGRSRVWPCMLGCVVRHAVCCCCCASRWSAWTPRPASCRSGVLWRSPRSTAADPRPTPSPPWQRGWRGPRTRTRLAVREPPNASPVGGVRRQVRWLLRL